LGRPVRVCSQPRLELVVDDASAIGAHPVGKTNHLDLGEAVLQRTLDDVGHPLERLLVGDAGRPVEAVDQGFLLGPLWLSAA
jgi:hypothetical protein